MTKLLALFSQFLIFFPLEGRRLPEPSSTDQFDQLEQMNRPSTRSLLDYDALSVGDLPLLQETFISGSILKTKIKRVETCRRCDH